MKKINEDRMVEKCRSGRIDSYVSVRKKARMGGREGGKVEEQKI